MPGHNEDAHDHAGLFELWSNFLLHLELHPETPVIRWRDAEFRVVKSGAVAEVVPAKLKAYQVDGDEEWKVPYEDEVESGDESSDSDL